MSNEGKIKLKVKVDTSELSKVKGVLQDIHTAETKGTETGNSVVTKRKAAKIATEELTKSEQYAAEVSKLLSEEQSQLATNFDFAEVSQKALGQAMQQFGGISAASVGILMGGVAAIGALVAVGYEYYGAINQQSIALKEAGVISEGYASTLHGLVTAEQALALATANTSIGLSTNVNDIERFGQQIIAAKSRFGQAGEGIVSRALEGDADAMRMLGIRVDETSTRIERQREARLRLAQTPIVETREQSGIVGTVTRWAEDAAAFLGVTVTSIENIKKRNQEENIAAQQRNADNARQQDAEERLARIRTDFANQRAGYDREAQERFIRLGLTTRQSDEDIARERRVNQEEYDRLRDTSGLRGEALQNRLNQLRDVGSRIQANDAEMARRNNTAAGIRERLRQEAIDRALAAGRTTHQLERISISNGQVRAQLELKIAELRQKLANASAADAETYRRAIADIIGQLSSTQGPAKQLITLTEIRDMILQIRRAVAESNQTDFIRGINEGTLSVEQQMSRLNELRNSRIDAETRYREALTFSSQLADQLESARNVRERQRIAELQRKANEEVTRTQENLRTITSSYDNAGQAIARSIREREEKATQERINDEKFAYDSRTRAIQNASRQTQDSLITNKQLFDAHIAVLEGSATDYQRTIAGLFSPEQMVQNINQGVRDASAVVASEQQRLNEMIATGASQEDVQTQSQRVVDARRNEAAATRDATQAVADLQQRMNDASFGGQFAKAMANNAKGMASMGQYAGGLAAKGLQTFSDAIWVSLDAIKSGGDIGAALNKMLTATLQSIGQEATVRALMETAAGFAALATPVTATMAPGHFAAAGVYAGVAALAGVGYMALPTPPEKADREREDTRSERDMLNARQNGNTVVFNSAAFAATKEELAKAGRKMLFSGIDL